MSTTPNFYDPNLVGELYVPDVNTAIAEGTAEANRRGYVRDEKRKRAILLLVDPQVDFIHVDGSLSVPGAVDDTRRTIEWIFRNVADIDAIAVSLDSHVPNQIFYPPWWKDANGNHPGPFTVIGSDQVDNGTWIPQFSGSWSRSYVAALESQAKKNLMIWPYHTMVGTPGHAVTPALYEAISFHTGFQGQQAQFIFKGNIPKTEHYSLLEPEVKVPDVAGGQLNTHFLNILASYDVIYVAGQAKSHCVLETLNSIDRNFSDAEMAMLHILMDCTSSVVHPDIDFEALSLPVYAGYEQRGAKLVVSTQHNIGDPVANYF